MTTKALEWLDGASERILEGESLEYRDGDSMFMLVDGSVARSYVSTKGRFRSGAQQVGVIDGNGKCVHITVSVQVPHGIVRLRGKELDDVKHFRSLTSLEEALNCLDRYRQIRMHSAVR